jgi:hypothetical protein
MTTQEAVLKEEDKAKRLAERRKERDKQDRAEAAERKKIKDEKDAVRIKAEKDKEKTRKAAQAKKDKDAEKRAALESKPAPPAKPLLKGLKIQKGITYIRNFLTPEFIAMGNPLIVNVAKVEKNLVYCEGLEKPIPLVEFDNNYVEY